MAWGATRVSQRRVYGNPSSVKDEIRIGVSEKEGKKGKGSRYLGSVTFKSFSARLSSGRNRRG